VQRFEDPGDAGAARDGIEAAWSDVVAADAPALAGIKHLNRLDSVLARAALRGGTAREALMRAADGRVIGGAMSNLFVCRGRELRTPAVDRAGVAGVMRSVVLREAAGLGFVVREGDLRPVDIAVASELFVTNARIGAWPIVALGAWRAAPGPVVRAFQARIAALDA
jgi:4-amino-4-deoxychorismate lyase